MTISLKKLTKIVPQNKVKTCSYNGRTYDPILGDYDKIIDTASHRSDMLKRRLRKNSGKLKQ